MARPRKFVGTLSAEDKQLLESISRSRKEEARKVQRAKAILMSAEGKTNDEISAQVGLSKPSINKILKKWSVFGLDSALEDLKRAGRPVTIRIEAKAWIISIACTMPENLPDAPLTQQWTITSLVDYLHEHCEKQGFPELKSITRSKVWNVLNDRDIKPHQMKYYLVRKDPEFEEKAKKVLLLYKRVEWILQMTKDQVAQGASPDKLSGEVFVSYDEKPGIQAIKNIAPDLPATVEHGRMARDYEYRRLGTVSLLAGIDLLSGEVTGLVRDSHSSEDFIDFLETLNKKYDSSLKINIILDNHSVHKSKAVMDYLATQRSGRFDFTFTPKHASWLNLVESFFSKLAKQSLRGLRVKSLDDLKKRILDWIKRTNEDRVPYRWKWQLEDIEGAFCGARS